MRRRHLLMAHIDDLNTLVDTAVVDIDNVATGNSEDVFNAFLLQHLGDDLAAGNLGNSGGLLVSVALAVAVSM